jgi:hypothetical protein
MKELSEIVTKESSEEEMLMTPPNALLSPQHDSYEQFASDVVTETEGGEEIERQEGKLVAEIIFLKQEPEMCRVVVSAVVRSAGGGDEAEFISNKLPFATVTLVAVNEVTSYVASSNSTKGETAKVSLETEHESRLSVPDVQERRANGTERVSRSGGMGEK